MELYHYTAIKNYSEIIQKECICLRAYHYSKYRSGDYAWIKRKIATLIKHICIDNGFSYDKTDVTDPFILCFSKNKNSLWKTFGKDYKGVQLIFNKETIAQYANKDQNPHVLMDCIYTCNKNRMRDFLLMDGYENYPYPTQNQLQGDLEEISAFIMKLKFRHEEECRYIIPYHKNTYYSNNEIKDEYICRGDYKELSFPKESLIGIRIGYKSAQYLNDVKLHLENCGYDLTKINVEVYKP